MPVWQSVYQQPKIIDHTSEEFSLEEQERLAAFRFMDLRRYEFLAAVSPGEGSLSTWLQKISIANIDRGLFVDKGWVDQAREILARRNGVPVDTALAEITARIAPQPVALAEPPAARGRGRPKVSPAVPRAVIHR